VTLIELSRIFLDFKNFFVSGGMFMKKIGYCLQIPHLPQFMHIYPLILANCALKLRFASYCSAIRRLLLTLLDSPTHSMSGSKCEGACTALRDAQTWVSRTRPEGDEHRQNQLRND
jgi:hypothetical protein